ncbi:MAG: metallopeptidase family protein [Elusimicrobiota bacterium]
MKKNIKFHTVLILIIKTVVHEIGHYFGFSEKDLQQYL